MLGFGGRDLRAKLALLEERAADLLVEALLAAGEQHGRLSSDGDDHRADGPFELQRITVGEERDLCSAVSFERHLHHVVVLGHDGARVERVRHWLSFVLIALGIVVVVAIVMYVVLVLL